MAKPVCPVCASEDTRIQTYLPSDRRVSPYTEGRCKACGAAWDLTTGQVDHDTKVRSDGA